MSYGLRLTNENGVSFLDDGAACFSVKKTGTTADFAAVRAAMGAAPVAAGNLWDLIPINRYNSHVWALCNPQIAATSLRYANFGSGFYGVLPDNTSDEDINDVAFYKLASHNIVGATSFVFDLPDSLIPTGSAHIIFEATGAPVAYKIVTTVNTSPKAGSVGLQIFGQSGEILFDSRDEIISIRHAARVTSAELISIMRAGATKVITMPESSDWWVCLPDHMPYCYFLNAGPLSGGWYDWRIAFVSVRQTGPAQITLQRQLSPPYWLRPPLGFTTDKINQLTIESAKDTTLLFARDV